MPIKFIFLILFFGLSIFLNACASKSTPPKDSAEMVDNLKTVNKVSANSPTGNAVNNFSRGVSNSADSACYNLKRDGMKLLKTQTFAIDFEPFKKSCFVTFYGQEFNNPPLGAQFYIYKNGKEIFNFPDQFNGGNVLCWVDDVAFEDLNDDDLKDIIIVGKCGAKDDSYNENMVYINTGEGFVTNKNANEELMDFSKAAEIKKNVENHESSLYKR